jgi:hypothetical protein
VDEDRAALFRSLLRPGEHVLWAGGPVVRRFVLRGSILAIPFTLLWLAFAIFWEANVLSSRAPGFFALWGIPFVAFGLYIAFGRFFVAAREARRTAYALTDERVLMIGGAFSPRITELLLRTLPPPSLEMGSDGVGTISFGPRLPFESFLPAGWPMMRSMSPSFSVIPDATAVFRMVDEAVAKARAGA